MQSRGNRTGGGGGEAARDAAEALAVEVLAYIAAEPAQLDRFISLMGLDVRNLRAAAAAPGFFAGVLDFLASDEALLLAFAANAGRDPAAVERAQRALAAPDGATAPER